MMTTIRDNSIFAAFARYPLGAAAAKSVEKSTKILRKSYVIFE